MKWRRPNWAMALLAWPALSAAEPIRIEVFTDPVRFPVTGTQATGASVSLHDLAKPKRLEQALSAGLPRDHSRAMALAQQRLDAEHIEAIAAKFTEAYGAHTLPVSYGIRRYPALVFDGGRAVIYGVSDLGEGLQRYLRWQANPPQTVGPAIQAGREVRP